MRVLILATDIYTRGGIARYTRTLADALGYLIGPERVDVLPLLGGTGPRFTPARYRILEPTTNRLTFPTKLQHTARTLRHSRGYELIICSHLGLTPLAAMAKRCYGTPYLVPCYGAEAWGEFPVRLKLGVNGADFLLPISQFTHQKLREVNGVSSEKMKLLHPAVPESFAGLLTHGSGIHPSVSPDNGHRKILLSVGNLARVHRYKGFETVIRTLPSILQAVPEAHYVIVGDGDDRPNLERLAAEIGVAEHLTFAGGVADAELAAYYRACDLFLLPSAAVQRNGHWEGEGFGLVYIEAALAGKPVVGSREGGAAEAVLPGKTGLLVNPGSTEEVARAVVALLRNPEMASTMGREGQRWATEKFTAAALHSSLEGLLSPYGLVD